MRYEKLLFNQLGYINSITVYHRDFGYECEYMDENAMRSITRNNVFYITNNYHKKDNENGIKYCIDDSCKLIKLIKYENGRIANITTLQEHGKLYNVACNFSDIDTMYTNQEKDTEIHLVRSFEKFTFHPNGRLQTFSTVFIPEGANHEEEFITLGKVTHFDENGDPVIISH